MQSSLRWTFLLLVFAVPAVAANKGGKYQGRKATEATEADYKALARLTKPVGQIIDLEGSDGQFTFRYESTYLEPNPGKIKAANQAVARQQKQYLRRYNQILKMRDPVKQAAALDKLLLQIQRQQSKGAQGLFKVKSVRKDFQLRATTDVKVRFLHPPIEYDDKGHVKKYTPQELKALKGKDPKLPGYEGTWDQLAEGQKVRLYFKKPKKKSKEDKDEEDLEETRPRVRMILILEDATSDDEVQKKKKKKK
jgi:hypothetical protein